MSEARRLWQEQMPDLDVRRLVFIDESGAKTNLTRTRGRSERGQRLKSFAPLGHWHTTTMISAVDLAGVRASMVDVEQGETGAAFGRGAHVCSVTRRHQGRAGLDQRRRLQRLLQRLRVRYVNVENALASALGTHV